MLTATPVLMLFVSTECELEGATSGLSLGGYFSCQFRLAYTIIRVTSSVSHVQ